MWLEIATRAADLIQDLKSNGFGVNQIITDAAVRNAMVVHAAFGGVLIYCFIFRRLRMRLVEAANGGGLAGGQRCCATTGKCSSEWSRDVSHGECFLAGGVPEVMLHLRDLGLLDTSVTTVEGQSWDTLLDEWKDSERRQRFRACYRSRKV